MLLSVALRNLRRNLRRTMLSGSAVTFGMVLAFWLIGVKHGGFIQMVDQAVETRLGHLSVLAEGYLERPEPRLVVPEAGRVVSTLAGLDHVEGVSPRAVAEGMVARDNESAHAEIVGVEPEAERRVSVVPERLFQGEAAVSWCRTSMADARQVMGDDDALFDRWCEAMRSSEFLPEGNDRAIVLGSGLARSLLVTVGDEVTVQVVRAVAGEGAEQGEVSQRRLEVTGIVRVGNAEVDDRLAYVGLETLTGMLGTDGPNEVVVRLDDIGNLDEATAEARRELSAVRGAGVYTWAQRNPALDSLVETGMGANDGVYTILFLLIALGVFNAISMSVLERTKEFGVMLALGTRRARLFRLVMAEVSLLGLLAIGVGAALGTGLELFGRIHGWPMAWFGLDEAAQNQVAGVAYETVYYSALSPQKGVSIAMTMLLMLLVAGLAPAIRAARLSPVEAMRVK